MLALAPRKKLVAQTCLERAGVSTVDVQPASDRSCDRRLREERVREVVPRDGRDDRVDPGDRLRRA